MEVGYKPYAIQPELGEQPFDSRTYLKAIGLIHFGALGTRPDITYATTILGSYAAQPWSLLWDAVKHLLRYLRDTSNFKSSIYNPSVGHDS